MARAARKIKRGQVLKARKAFDAAQRKARRQKALAEKARVRTAQQRALAQGAAFSVEFEMRHGNDATNQRAPYAEPTP